jgi:hypothetical protein
MNPATAEQVAQSKAGRIEIVMPLTPVQLKSFSDDLEQLARRLDLPDWASNTELIIEAVHRQAHPE